jgi:hypothetical protein
MNADVILTIAFVLYAVVVAIGVGLLLARSGHDGGLDEALENRFNGASSARSAHRRTWPQGIDCIPFERKARTHDGNVRNCERVVDHRAGLRVVGF